MKKQRFTMHHTISFRPEVFEQIKMITEKEETSFAEFVRQAVDLALAKIKQKEETM